MTKSLRGWDDFVKEAEEAYDDRVQVKALDFPIDGKTYRIEYPSVDVMRKTRAALMAGDWDAAALHLLGDEAGSRVVELSGPLKVNPIPSIVTEVMSTFALAVVEEGKAPEKPSRRSGRASRSSNGTGKRSSST